MSKIDLRKELKQYYSAKRKPGLIDVPPGKFLSIIGKGAPDGEEYQAAIQALYGLSYTLKFKSKAEGTDYTVMGLEGLWWWDYPTITSLNDAPLREEWNWKAMIRQPDFITEKMLEEISPEVKEKRGPTVDRVVLEVLHEGLCAQVMHVGPYSEEGPTGELLHRFIVEQGYRMRGRHHEIYLSDPRRSKPENIKTILRQPVEKITE
ncbi:MAG: GyrI-like domain-containing protein [Candidatus Bathyarchaeota archaeon]|nr:GyrI-like domain-containing protein [Candidatus Bathyarchaeota archaeon]